METINSITSFKVAGEYFGVESIKVLHILEMTEPTHVPLSKEYFLGVINNHGNMIPVVDFRMMLGAEREENLPEASIIIVSIDGTNETLVGFKVDEVDEVFDYNPQSVKNDVVLEVSKEVQPSLRGTLEDGEKFVYLINLDVLSKELEK